MPFPSLLQWVRDQMIAELAAALLWTNFSVMLQWDRNQRIAELPRNIGIIMGFWVLQWGPRSVDRGIGTRGIRTPFSLPCFNGSATR